MSVKDIIDNVPKQPFAKVKLELECEWDDFGNFLEGMKDLCNQIRCYGAVNKATLTIPQMTEVEISKGLY